MSVTITTDPVNGASKVRRTAVVRATFSGPMKQSTFTASSFTLTAGGPPLVAGIFYDPSTRTASLQPLRILSPSTTFTATLTTQIQESNGTPLPAPVIWTFTTRRQLSPRWFPRLAPDRRRYRHG
jgi:hypothetical protein